MKFIKELVIPDSLIIICESRRLHQHASHVDLLQCDDDKHHRWTRCSVIMTCITGARTRCSVMMDQPDKNDGGVMMEHASPMDSLQ